MTSGRGWGFGRLTSLGTLLSVLAVTATLAGWPRFLLSGVARDRPRPPVSQSPMAGSALIGELGCPACHPGLTMTADLIRSRAPSLQSAGARYQPGYLFGFLQNPNRIRRHIGASRMPAFGLDERESLALTLYLQSLNAIRPLPANAPSELTSARLPRGARRDAEQLITGELGCLACHTLRGTGGATAAELLDTGYRLRPEWMARYLAAPSVLDPGTPMPALFFDPERAEAFRPRIPDAARKLRIVAEYLRVAAEDTAQAQQRAFERASRAHPDVTADLGRSIFGALNCGGCHRSPQEPGGDVGPDLSRVGRLRPEWLRDFVRHPVAVRPFGFHPGTGSRMPDFGLSNEEADSMTAYLIRAAGPGPAEAFEPLALTAFSRDKALRFMRDRFACLGCHRLDGVGGRVGPDLSGVAARLTTRAIRAMIRNPRHTMPQSIMPMQVMPDSRLDLIASFLAERSRSDADAYLSLTEHPIASVTTDIDDGGGVYQRFCASCHGRDGDGDGYNAAFLPVPPTRHADSSYMSTRPDDTLFDGVHAGGHILGRDHRMPAFGQRLDAQQIRAVVRYMRELCNCEGPVWSRDGGSE